MLIACACTGAGAGTIVTIMIESSDLEEGSSLATVDLGDEWDTGRTIEDTHIKQTGARPISPTEADKKGSQMRFFCLRDVLSRYFVQRIQLFTNNIIEMSKQNKVPQKLQEVFENMVRFCFLF